MEARPPLVVIVGPTASGKTDLALDIAERHGGEIVCADSRTVYVGMDIGTAKPTAEDRRRVPHHGLDLVRPNERFTASDFKHHAEGAIADIRSRSKFPVLVGGTGLYVDSVVYDYTFGGTADFKLRQKLERMTIQQLHEYCAINNVTLPENRLNRRHVVRAIERKSISGISKTIKPEDTIIVGIATNTDTLRTRISARTEHMFASNVANEATILGKKYGWDHESMTGNIYPILKSYLLDELSLRQAKDQFTTLDHRLAKRQMTWFRRNPDIMWATRTEARRYLERVLAAE